VIRHTLREWDYLPVGDEPGAISRRHADDLMLVARRSGLGGADGETVLVNGHRRLRAQQVVGVLAGGGVTLEILPKIDGLNEGEVRRQLVHMLARVFDLKVSSGVLTELSWQQHDLLEVVIRLFCEQLFQAVHRGLPRRYVGHEDDLPMLRGRLDVQRQFTILAARPQKLASRFDDLSADTPLNQIMKAAVLRLRRVARSPENQRRLAELALAFADVTTVPVGMLPWRLVVIDRTNAAWALLLALAKFLLGERFQTTSGGDAVGFSLLFEMNTLFEEFVGRTLRRALSGTGLTVELQGPRGHVLIDEGGARRFATKPDIVVRDGADVVLVIDTKWKRLKGALDDPKHGVSQADVYQMMAYSRVYRCERVVLLYPHHQGLQKPSGVVAAHRVSGSDVRLSVRAVSLANLDGLGGQLSALVHDELAATAPGQLIAQ
jgi:5-methylcytosine-specific restriction enzyme subunit McrC